MYSKILHLFCLLTLLLLTLLGPVSFALAEEPPDLVLNISDDGYDPVSAGGEVVYTMTVSNSGDLTATETALIVTLPEDVTYNGYTGSSCSYTAVSGSNDTVTCDLGDLVYGDSQTLTFSITPTASGTISTSAVVTMTTTAEQTVAETETGNNSVDESTTVDAGADVALSLTPSATEVSAGSDLSYTLELTNNGPDAATYQQVTFTLPTGFQVSSIPSSCSNSDDTLTCLIDDSIAKGAVYTLGTVSGVASRLGGSTITATASVSVQDDAPYGTAEDPVTDNNTATVNVTVAAGSDVWITKTRSVSGSLLLGAAFNFNLAVAYSGDAPTNVSLSDTLPAAYEIDTDSFNSSQGNWTCTIDSVDSQTVTCSYAGSDNSSGYSISLGSVTIPVTVVKAGSTVINTAYVSSDSSDPDPGNNSDTDGGVNLLEPTVELTITKSGPSPALVVVDNSFEFSIAVSNGGTTGFYGELEVVDTLPIGMNVTAYTGDGWTCTPETITNNDSTSQTMTCTRTYTEASPLAAGASTPALVMTADVVADGTFTNSASVSAGSCNLDSGCGSDSATYNVSGSISADSADVSINKTASGTVAAGDILTYTLELINNGSDTSEAITLTDTITRLINSSVGDTGAGFISYSISDDAKKLSGISCSTSGYGSTGRTLSCTIDSLAACTSGTDCPTIAVQVRPSGSTSSWNNPSSRSNTATILSLGTADPDHDNDSSTVTSSVLPRGDLTVTAVASGSTIPAGQNVTYVITAGNDGPSALADVTVTDSLPDDVTFISATPSTGSCATVPAAGATTSGSSVECNLGSIASGSQQTLTLVVRPNDVTYGSNIENRASVATTQGDDFETNTSNNSASVDVVVDAPVVDLVLNLTDDTDPVAVGDTTAYTLKVTNRGPSVSEGATLTISLPGDGLDFGSISTESGSCGTYTDGDSTLSCDLNALTVGSSSAVTLTMEGASKGITSISASVTPTVTSEATGESATNNNSDTETTTVRTKADMAVDAVSPADTSGSTISEIPLEDDFELLVTVVNNTGDGLAEADDVVVSSSLPSGVILTGAPSLVVDSGTASESNCSGSSGGRSYSCDLGTVSSGASITLTVPVRVTKVTTNPQTFKNTVSVATSSKDVDSSNDSNSGSIAVTSSSLSGTLFRDFNDDAALTTAADTGISGVKVTIAGNSVLGTAVSTTATTASDGSFTINLLPEADSEGYTLSLGTVSEKYLNDGTDTAGSAGGTAASATDTISAIPLGDAVTATGYLFAKVPQARIGAALAASTPTTSTTDSTFTTTLTLVLENFSLEAVNDVSAILDLTPLGALMPEGASTLAHGQYRINSVNSGTCSSVNSNFDGVNDTTLVSAETLASGSSCKMTLTLQVLPTEPLPADAYELQASLSGMGELSGQSPADVSDNGSNPDPDNDDQANEDGENDATPVDPDYGGAITVSKTLNENISIADDGSVTAPIKLIVTNSGDERLSSVTISDELDAAFGTFMPGGTSATLSGGQYTIIDGVSGSCLNSDETVNPDITVNSYFEGSSESSLATLGTMEIGESCTLTFSYRFMPTYQASYMNTATATATGMYTEDEVNGSGTLAVPYPRVGLAEALTNGGTDGKTLDAASDGSVSASFSVLVENLGSETLSDVVISNPLAGTDTAFGTFVSGGSSAELDYGQYTIISAPSGCNDSGNSSFDGSATTTLATLSSLAIKGRCTLSYSVRFRPVNGVLPDNSTYFTQASVTAKGASSALEVSDDSDNGSDVDGNDDGLSNGADEDDPTPLVVSFTPQIAINKYIDGGVTINSDGSVSAPFRVVVSNYGNEPLTSGTITDTLAGSAPAFGTYVSEISSGLSAGQYSITSAPTLGTGCSAASVSSYDGNTNNTLATALSLEPEASCTIAFTLRFMPSDPLPDGGYSNQATGIASGFYSGTATDDDSQTGTDPDPDENGDPTDNDEPTVVPTEYTAAIGVAKDLTDISAEDDGSYTAVFSLVVENLSDEGLDTVTVSDELNSSPSNLGDYVSGGSSADLVAGQYTIASAPAISGSCSGGSAVTSYDGTSSHPDLLAISSMAIDASCKVSFAVRFIPADTSASYYNQATASSTGSYSDVAVSDLSDNGASVDTDGDGLANEDGENDATPIPLPVLSLTKEAGDVTNMEDGSYEVAFTLTLKNSGQTALDQLQISDSLSAFGTYTNEEIPAAGEYTIASAPTLSSSSNNAVLSLDSDFTGSGDNVTLLAAGSSLPDYGTNPSSGVVSFTIRFTPTEGGVFTNRATATASYNLSISASASVTLSDQVIGLAKDLGDVVQESTTSISVPYRFIVSNLSAGITATNVQVTDDLSATFPTASALTIASAVSVSNCSGSTLTANSSFDGITNQRLLSGSDNLQPGESCQLDFTLLVDFGGNGLPDAVQYNQATATTAQIAGGTVIATDLSDSGSTVDSDGDGNPDEDGENDPTPLDLSSTGLASISGSIWLDSNHDRTDNDGSSGDLPLFTIEVMNATGTIVASGSSDSSGDYTITGIVPSTSAAEMTYYSVRFREQSSGAVYGDPLSEDPTHPNGVVSNGIITGLQLLAGVETSGQDLPLDPSGIVYDSVSREPVSGATVTLSGPAGFDAASDLLGGTANVSQTTGSSGYYQFILLTSAPAGSYTLEVTPPGGYVPTTSSMVPVCSNTPTVAATPSPALVQNRSEAPTSSVDLQDADSCPTTSGGFADSYNSSQYYLSFVLTPGTSGDVVNNHIPVDPVLDDAITLVKTTPLVNVTIGQLVPYTITAINTLAADLSHIDIHDVIPPGFKYKSGSATIDGVHQTPEVHGRDLAWTDLELGAGESLVIKLVLVVGSGVQSGKYVNSAQAYNNLVSGDDNAVSNRATATVRVVPDPLFDCADVIGKVFDDRNADGYQDQGEPGLPHVRLATARGLRVTTDDQGRFHIACAMVPNSLHGSNFVMKVDERTLPSGYRITSENPRSVLLTRGKMGKINFGATIHRVIRVELTAAAFAADGSEPGSELQQAMPGLMAQLAASPCVVRLAYNREAEPPDLIGKRLRAVRKLIEKQWQEQDKPYSLQFEEEQFSRHLQSKGGAQ